MNYAKTALLLAALTAIFVAMGALVGGRSGLLIAFAIALVMNVMSLWKSDTMVLKMFKAQEVDDSSAPELVSLVRTLAARAELPMPRVYIMNNPQPNAFATGRSPSRAAVCASTGLLETLTREELAGVIAHELAHIKNRDTLTMAVAATIGGAVSMFAQYLQFGAIFGSGRSDDRGALGGFGTLVAMLLAPMAAMVVQMSISRSREYAADRMGAMISGNPLWLASALKKINAKARQVINRRAEEIPAAAHMFIVNPLNGRGIDSLFSTHPNVDNRIAELEALAREMGITGSTAALDDLPSNGGDLSGGDPREVWVAGQNHSQNSGRSRRPWG
ncbi:MAG: zinc metalloprotease HtpX [Hyphomicrobium sp.]|nr:zinc metalloprotease HtpX [Hyphomicrobium sp.]